MRENRVKTIWRQGGAVVNGWLGIPNTFSAEMMANTPYDSITVDTQHGMVDFADAVQMFGAVSVYAPTPLARVPWNDPGAIMKLLDAGAYGIICPMINTAEECERFVGACRYAPRGYRSFGPPRGMLYGGADYAQHANDTILTFAMIETREALDNLDGIMRVEELDGIYIGPADLAISLGNPPSGIPEAGNVIAAIDTILAAAERHDVIAGIHCGSGQMARQMFDKGFQLCTLMNDSRLMSSGAQAAIKAARGQD